MSVKFRQYKLLGDFDKVLKYLSDVYNTDTLNGYLLPQFFEYAHTHPVFNHKLTHRIGLWEDNNLIVGMACFEMDIGECFISFSKGYNELLPEIIKYSEKNLSNNNSLSIWIIDKELEKRNILEKMEYKKVYSTPVTVFNYEHNFPQYSLPVGF